MSAGDGGIAGARPADTGRHGDRHELHVGMAAALSAYLFWGLSVVFFKWLSGISVWEVLAHRVVWSVLLIGLFLIALGRWAEVRAAIANKAVRNALMLSTILIAINWSVFIWAVDAGHVLQASFGYFINPLVNVALGFLLLGERLSRWQWVAVGLAALSVAMQAVLLPGFPWVSLTLALSFGFYGYVRKKAPVGASPGLFVETLFLLPLSLLFIAYLGATGTDQFSDDGITMLKLVLTGIVTTLPLILFTVGARRLRLATIGLFQYLAPSIHFLLAVFVYGEPLSAIRLASFALIWVSLVLYTVDSLRRRPAVPTAAPA